MLTGRFTSALCRLVVPVKSHAASERQRNHLDELFTFIRDPLVDATDWRAEQAGTARRVVRPAVGTAKSGVAIAPGLEPKPSPA